MGSALMSGRLAGKNAIITGAAHGQGLAAAKLFTEEGARVAIFDLDGAAAEAAAAEIGGSTIAVTCDVSNSASVKAGVERVVAEFGGVDVLHNNAGAAFRKAGEWDPSQDGSILDITEELFDRSIGVNLKSVFLMCKNVLPHMIKAGGGSIINVSSLAGPVTGSSSHAYCAAKGGVTGLTRAIALGMGPHGVRCNAILPGLVETPLVAHILENEEWRQSFANSAALRRIAQPIDMARVALFLASDDSGFMTGAMVTVDGGVSIRN
jgi:NAD(P)-dependent dehydrogenase (short-subunit alcohol dehydrogenase family)